MIVRQYILPEGCVVVALGNREDDDGVYIRLAGPLADRFEIHYIDVDFNSWKYDFAIPFGIHNYIVDYLSFQPAALHNQSESKDEMVFATPRSWERVSDILKIDDNLNNPVVCHKIIGNVGESEGNQFIRYVKNHSGLISVDEFLAGKDVEEKPEIISTLVNSLMDKANFVRNKQAFEELDAGQKEELSKIIGSLFRFKSAEYTIMGIKQLMELNRPVIKSAFTQCDDTKIDEFLERHASALGL